MNQHTSFFIRPVRLRKELYRKTAQNLSTDLHKSIVGVTGFRQDRFHLQGGRRVPQHQSTAAGTRNSRTAVVHDVQDYVRCGYFSERSGLETFLFTPRQLGNVTVAHHRAGQLAFAIESQFKITALYTFAGFVVANGHYRRLSGHATRKCQPQALSKRGLHLFPTRSNRSAAPSTPHGCTAGLSAPDRASPMRPSPIQLPNTRCHCSANTSSSSHEYAMSLHRFQVFNRVSGNAWCDLHQQPFAHRTAAENRNEVCEYLSRPVIRCFAVVAFGMGMKVALGPIRESIHKVGNPFRRSVVLVPVVIVECRVLHGPYRQKRPT